MKGEVSVNISAKHLRAVLHLAPSKQEREYLNSILLEVNAQGVILVGTNGVAMGVALVEKAPTAYPDMRVPLPLELFKGLKKNLSVVAVGIRFGECNGDEIADVTCCGASARAFPAYYPNWRVAVPHDPASGRISQYDPAQLVKFAKAARELGVETPPVIAHNGASTALVSIHRDDFFGLITPIQFNGIPVTAPEWALV